MQVDKPWAPPLVLEGHSGEVSGVAWCQADACQVATCGDDAVVKVWKVNRDAPRQKRAALPVRIGHIPLISSLSIGTIQSAMDSLQLLHMLQQTFLP